MRRWLAAKGSRVALFPNLNVNDPVWRELFRKADFRRALSIAINRDDINNAIFYGLATPSNNTVLPQSPLFEETYPHQVDAIRPGPRQPLLDGLGLTERDGDGLRLLPDGRPMQIVIETAGEEVEQTDVLELVRDDWQKIGIGVFIKPSQREVFYNRIKAGDRRRCRSGRGWRTPCRTPRSAPAELVPMAPEQSQWPAWGLWAQTSRPDGRGARPRGRDRAHGAEEGMGRDRRSRRARPAIWQEMLRSGPTRSSPSASCRASTSWSWSATGCSNVPEHGIYNFDPGAFFGIYRPDTFWLESE